MEKAYQSISIALPSFFSRRRISGEERLNQTGDNLRAEVLRSASHGLVPCI
jgi:hypothetical protein